MSLTAAQFGRAVRAVTVPEVDRSSASDPGDDTRVQFSSVLAPLLLALGRGVRLTTDSAIREVLARAADQAPAAFSTAEGRARCALTLAGALSLGFLSDADSPALSAAANRIAELTLDIGASESAPPAASNELGDLCVLWALTTRAVIVRGHSQVTDQLIWLPEGRREFWRGRLDPGASNLGESAGTSDGPFKIFRAALSGLTEHPNLANMQWDVPAEAVSTTNAQELTDLVRRATIPHVHGEWAGSDIDSMLKRATSGVVARFTSIAYTSDFETPGELQDWLNASAVEASSPARFEVKRAYTSPTIAPTKVLREVAYFGADHFHSPDAPGGIPEGCAGEPERVLSPLGFHPVLTPDRLFGIEFFMDHSPMLGADYEGDLLIGFHSMFTLERAKIARFFTEKKPPKRAFALPPLNKDEAQGSEKDTNSSPVWFFTRIVGTDAYLTIPSQVAVLQLEFDHDGAAVTLDVFGAEEYDAWIRTQTVFQSDWARWLDDDLPLSEADVQEGVARAEQLARVHIAAESATRGVR